MTTVEDAHRYIAMHTKAYGIEELPLLQSLKRTLAKGVVADRDFPPYHRVMMDGIAISSAAFQKGVRDFAIEKVQAAGFPLQALDDNENCCIEVMTGAVLPVNTDVVIPYEECEINTGVAAVKANAVKPFQHVHLQGADGRAGMELIAAGTTISPVDIGIMATVGLGKVPVYKLPVIAICSTGDELVDTDEQPLPHQVRKSNVYMLAAALMQEGINAQLYHLRDNKKEMLQQLANIVDNADVVLLSGAVSKGKFDYLPEVLQTLGMQTVFHRVEQRPGKPFLFGAFPDEKLVFGFPGNPVSTFVCYQLYFKKWLQAAVRCAAKPQPARLSEDVTFEPKLACHLLVTLDNQEGEWLATPIKRSNSGDMTSLLNADAILTLPAVRALKQSIPKPVVVFLAGNAGQ